MSIRTALLKLDTLADNLIALTKVQIKLPGVSVTQETKPAPASPIPARVASRPPQPVQIDVIPWLENVFRGWTEAGDLVALSDVDRAMLPRIVVFAKEWRALSGRENSEVVVSTSGGKRKLVDVLAGKAAMEAPISEPAAPGCG